MNADRALKVMNWSVLALVAAAILNYLVGCAGVTDAIGSSNSKLAENAAPTFWGTLLGFGVFVLSGGTDLLAGALASLVGAVVAIFSHAPKVAVPVDLGSLVPWYLDPMSFVRPILAWLGIAILVGLFFPRSRQQTVQFLKDAVTGHPILGARRFLAAMGWVHSDPIPDRKKQIRVPTRPTGD